MPLQRLRDEARNWPWFVSWVDSKSQAVRLVVVDRHVKSETPTLAFRVEIGLPKIVAMHALVEFYAVEKQFRAARRAQVAKGNWHIAHAASQREGSAVLRGARRWLDTNFPACRFA